jgi:hypothetical protein
MRDEQKLATIEKNPLATPDFLKGVHGREGSENVTKDDLIIPRLSICQSLTPQRKPDNPAYIQGLQEGDLFNTVSGEKYGRSVEFIPLIFAKSRIYFKDIKEGGGILCSSANGIDGGRLSKTCAACPKSQFTAEAAPECTNFMNFPSLLLPELGLIAASFKSSGLKPARQFLNRLDLFSQQHDKPYYTGVYELKVIPMKNTMGEFFGPSFTRKRWVTEQEYLVAHENYTQLKGKTIQTDEARAEGAHEEVPF